ncbi:lysM and putative peptidoglycan-binding domain-containing protein 2 [Thrips palmi]|uniref:LysM and putative peptidoglycan-binding domain-containing protein 2 n=1 Tax=Thrips palmi TaxID=161013 RepID=A0A6P8ZB93_THRPL|nr:lysM and putative peptidoglycan-binding domain-containing protein 2 [Thrips palmi]
MADGGTDERRSIRDSARSLKRYGSTSSHQKRPEQLIKHVVCKTDTLQGLALRYGVTTEQIRRANRLFANDSLFLREYLMIPVPDTDGMLSSSGSAGASVISSPASPMSPSSTENGFSDEHSIDEFLDKIDSSIASTKNQVQKVQGNSSLYSEDDIFTRKRPPVSRLRQQNQHQVVAPSSSEILSAPHPIVMTQGRKVRTSLQRLQREQDEMFEL